MWRFILLYGSDEVPCFGGGDGSLPAFGEAPASVKPCGDALDDTAARQDEEAADIGAPDDLDGNAVEMCDGGLQLLSGIAAIGEQASERGICVPAAVDEVQRAVTFLDIGGMD